VILLGKNRDSLSIVAAILEAANSGPTKTKIMFSAGLSFSLLEKYLDIVIEAGFVQVIGSRYHLTKCGLDFLKQYEDFERRYLKAQKLFEALEVERENLTRFYEEHKQLKLASDRLIKSKL
jgi:predicted transcriptional regulator